MMKILTRISVVLLLAAGVYFLREANINKTNVSETTISEEKNISSNKDLKLEFKEEESQEKIQKQEALKERIEALRKNSEKNTKTVAITKIATASTVKNIQAPLLSTAQIEQEVEEIVKESKITPITIFLYEWELDISDRTIPTGKILFEVHNDGWFSHDFALKDGENFGKVFPGEVAYFLTDHLETGEYVVYSPKLIDEMYHIEETFTVE